MPDIWRPVNRGKSDGPSERKHGDGILVDFDSVEAIEEFFWKAVSDDAYIGKDALRFDTINASKIVAFNDYVAAVIRCHPDAEAPIYLAKNNNHVVRLAALLDQLTDAHFIVPFRRPVDHAVSLMNQHDRFSSLQREDGFVLEFMDWLGHHEFGLHAKWFDLGQPELTALIAQYPRFEINHWLAVWLNYYTYVDGFEEMQHVLPFSYERFCVEPGVSIKKLAQRIGFVTDLEPEPFRKTATEKPTGLDRELVARCEERYDRLSARAVN